MKQKSRKYKRYIRKQIKKQLQTTANSLEQKIQEKEDMKQSNLSKALASIEEQTRDEILAIFSICILAASLSVFIEAKNSVKTSSEILSKSISFFKIITSLSGL